MSSIGGDSLPDLPPESPGSSVSTRLMEEYEELLKYAAVVPNYDPKQLPQKLVDTRESFPQSTTERLVPMQLEREEESDADADTTPVVVKVTRESGLPDFGQSPIHSKHSQDSDGETQRDRYTDVKHSHESEDTPRNAYTAEEEQSRIPPPLFQSKISTHPQDSHRSETSEHYSSRRTNPEEQRGQMSYSDQVQRSYMSEHTVTDTEYVTTIDPDITKMENMLDQWTSELKQNVLAEFSQAKIHIVEKGKQTMMREKQCFASEKTQLQNEIERLKELLHTYETSIQRKDQVISNLTQALSNQKDKQEVMKNFSEWKVKHIDLKRENFASKLAMNHYERRLQQKVWEAWHSVIENKWRDRVEKACQAKAQEVCMQLTNDYEAKVTELTQALTSAREEISHLHRERERYEEAMKKAFMRGVCALNLEAMTMFNKDEQSGERVSGEFSDNLESSLPDKDLTTSKAIPQEVMSQQPLPKVITSQGARPSAVAELALSRSSMSASETKTAELQHALEFFNSGLKCITAKDVSELKSYKSPPNKVKLVVEAVGIMMGVKPVKGKDSQGRPVDDFYSATVKILGDTNFLKNVRNFDKDNISPSGMKKIREKYMTDPEFEPSAIRPTSLAAEGLCRWIRALEAYDRLKDSFGSSFQGSTITSSVITSKSGLGSSGSVTGRGSRPISASKVKTSSSLGDGSKVSSTSRPGYSELGISGVAPPMSSVVVERHQPVNKQTIGQATAMKYPKKTSTLSDYTPSNVQHRKLAGQMGPVQTVKVVD